MIMHNVVQLKWKFLEVPLPPVGQGWGEQVEERVCVGVCCVCARARALSLDLTKALMDLGVSGESDLHTCIWRVDC
jgi:hypothetical protein